MSPTQNDHASEYFDALLCSYDALIHAVEQASEHGIKLSRELLADMVASQRQTLEVARQVASNPEDMAAAYTAIMESVLSAQNKALEFTQSTYREAMTASTETREALESVFSASRSASEAALALAREWQTTNPWADLLQKNMPGFGDAAGAKTANKG